ncbi:dTDP-4-dehydrorhamnose reductase [Vallitalea guaymasensis]|uniref:dTDP-4-dehydrorhamnose reductase n=1 Tax=Vallitalea guaymasensis TaxID=1185412 RepID=UPI00272C015E|nr:dTDP-4-dehydrorhamnose reductase [Vallitalea guaymasensis]
MIIGVNGQLGHDAVKLLSTYHKIVGLDKDTLDITNFIELQNRITEIRPEVIINCAGYTNVDDCEINYESAYNTNAQGCYNLALIAKKYDCILVHISTDYVFDGEKDEPYIESDLPNPINIYGSSKLLGETIITTISPKYFILRTSWLYGTHGKNFVKTILKLSETKDVISVVNDQIGTPTYTIDIINVISKLIKTNIYGIYHVSNEGRCSWYEFAEKIIKLTNKETTIIPITTNQSKRKADRPHYSVLENSMLKHRFGYTLRNWEEALTEFLKVDME